MAAPATAHDGPPYPIIVDRVVGDYTLSIWTDPDVGEGTFYYYVDASEGHSPDDVRIEVVSRPEDKSAEAVSGTSVPAEERDAFQQTGTLEFAHQGTWSTVFRVHPVDEPDALLGELDYDLEVTPPGLNLLYAIWYAIPFLALAALWLRGLLAQRAYERGEGPHATAAASAEEVERTPS